MKLIELFGGIGACTKAFKNIGMNVDVVDYVEIDKYAVKSYNAINGTNFEPQDIKEWDKDINVDIIMHGSPCQDFSVAGKQAGGDLGSGTRSSLLYETIRIVGKLRPKYVIWENVKNLLSKKHKHNFDNYIETMNILGYNSYYQVLNAKDYGIPQNRERVYTISIRKDIDNGNFKFPEKEELKLRLKDILEDKVDEKYYLKDYQLENIKKSNYIQNQRRIQEKDYCDTLCARDWKDPKCVRVGGIFDTENSKHQAGSIYDKEGLAPTLDAMQGGWRQPSIVEEPKIEVVGNYSPSNHDASRIVNENGLAPTVKENHGTVTAIIENKLSEAYGRNFGSKGKLQDTEGTYATLQAAMRNGGGNAPIIKEFNSGEFRDLNEYIEYLQSLQEELEETVEYDFELEDGTEIRVRKLTPKECWRLMGFDDKDFDRAEKVNSNTQLYKQARKLNCSKGFRKNIFKFI